MSERHIQTMGDIAQLTPDEFARFLPDLAAWHGFAHAAESIGVECRSMHWIDDKRPGVINYVDVVQGENVTRFQIEKGKQ